MSARAVARRARARSSERRRNRVLILTLGLVMAVGVFGLLYAARSDRTTDAAFAVGVGDRAPDFALPTVHGGEFSLARARQAGAVLLFFYEGLMCQPCWDQLVAIQRESAQFRALGIEVVGITVDPLRYTMAKAQQEGIALPVLADDGARISRTYDTLRVGSMHPGQRPGHVFILVGRDGIVLWRQDYREMFVPTGRILQSLRSLRN